MFATCHTEGCGNAAQPVEVPDDAAQVACGVCNQPITDLTDTAPTLPEELPPWGL